MIGYAELRYLHYMLSRHEWKCLEGFFEMTHCSPNVSALRCWTFRVILLLGLRLPLLPWCDANFWRSAIVLCRWTSTNLTARMAKKTHDETAQSEMQSFG